jgi:hypothetical protein
MWKLIEAYTRENAGSFTTSPLYVADYKQVVCEVYVNNVSGSGDYYDVVIQLSFNGAVWRYAASVNDYDTPGNLTRTTAPTYEGRLSVDGVFTSEAIDVVGNYVRVVVTQYGTALQANLRVEIWGEQS